MQAANGRTYKRKQGYIQGNMRHKWNRTTYDDYTLIPFFSSDSNHDDFTTANNSTLPHEKHTLEQPTQTRRLPTELNEYVVYRFLMLKVVTRNT